MRFRKPACDSHRSCPIQARLSRLLPLSEVPTRSTVLPAMENVGDNGLLMRHISPLFWKVTYNLPSGPSLTEEGALIRPTGTPLIVEVGPNRVTMEFRSTL